MMQRKLILTLAALMWLLPLRAQEETEVAQGLTAAQLTEKGVNAEQLGLTELAEKYYRKAIENDNSGDEQPYLRLGILLEQKEYYDEAARMLSRCSSAEALGHQAFCLIQQRLIDSASHCAERAIEADPKSALAMSMMAYVETERDQHVNAIAWANRALKAEPNYARGENVMGYIQFRKGNHTEAMRHFKKAIQLDSTLAEAYYNLGTLYCIYTAMAYAYRMRGDDPKAMECYNQILEYDSIHTPTLNRIGVLYREQGHYERAIAFHRRALSIHPNDASAYKYIGKAYIDWGNYDKAIQNFIRATNISTTDDETYMYLAELYGKQKKGERKQQSAYKKAARLGNKEAQAWLVKKGIGW